MKIKFLLILFFAGLFLFSCNNPSRNKVSITNVTADTTGYYAARNMKGLANFVLGESTINEIVEIIKAEIKEDYNIHKETSQIPQYRGYEEKYTDFIYDENGKAIKSFYREDFGSIFKIFTYDTIKSNLFKNNDLDNERFGCPQIKSIEMFKYYITGLEINGLELKFYNDTLYEIFCWHNSGIEEGFIAKYGDGKGGDNSDSKIIDKLIVWENEFITATSKDYVKHENIGNENIETVYSDSYFIMILKNENLINEIHNCEKNAVELEKKFIESERQSEFDKL